MPAYRFEALHAQGKARTGLLEGDNPKTVRTQLRAQGLVPIGVEPIAAALEGGGKARFTRRVFSTTTLAVWTRQLAGLVAAGLPLERSLTALSDEAEDPRQRDLVAHLRAEVNGAPRLPGRWPARRGNSTMSIERWWRPASRAARSARSSSGWPTTWKRSRR